MPSSKRYFVLFMIIVALIALFAIQGNSTSKPAKPSGGDNPIVLENQQPGTDDWRIPGLEISDTYTGSNPIFDQAASNSAPRQAWTDTQVIKGYASASSINKGQSINLHVSTTQPSFNIDIYRIGWYNGAGGRFITGVRGLTGANRGIPAPNPAQGNIIEAAWPVSYTLNTTASWVSGAYVAKLTTSNSDYAYIFFVVRDDSSTADVVFTIADSTYQAYNNWGGKSLYDFNSTNGRSYKVSYNRPYALFDGAGYLFDGDYQMIRWLEREGYNVTYATSVDMHSNPNLLDGHEVFLSNYHDEYWSWEMRENLTNAIDDGVDAAFFTSNNIYWQIRYEPSTINGAPNRTQVCFKDRTIDPFASGPNFRKTTVQWRQTPVDMPENEILGVMWEGVFDDELSFPWVVTNANHWVYNNTGLMEGEAIAQVIGDEYDRVWDNGLTPSNLVVLSNSTVDEGGIANASIYQADSGAYIFDASTNYWSYKLDHTVFREEFTVDWRIEQITRNVLNTMIGAAPTPPAQGPSYIYDDALTITWEDNNSPVNYASTSPTPHTGTRAISLTDSGASGTRLSIRTETPISTTTYDTLQFAMRTTAANKDFEVFFWDVNEEELGLVEVSSYGGTPPTGSWRVYQIPLADLGALNTYIRYLWIDPISTSGYTVYIDDIALVRLNAAPLAPTNLSASTSVNNQVTLNWTDNATNETNYRVERSLDGASWSEIAVLPANSTTHGDTNVVCGTNYQYRVRAFRTTGSLFSNPSNPAVGSPFCPNFIQSHNTRIMREGNWATVVDPLASGSSYLTASTQNDVMTMFFAGTTIEVVFLKGPGQGSFAIEVDGVVLRTVDTNDVALGYFFKSTIDYLSAANHVLRLYPVAGTVAIDAYFVPPPAFANPPAAPTLVSPSGTVPSGSPTFTWNASANTEWYYLIIEDLNTVYWQQWHLATTVCAGATCSLTPPLNLLTGNFAWRVRSANSSGAGAWSSTVGFNIPAGATTLQNPNGTIITSTPIYKWVAAPSATWYHLIVRNAGNVNIIDAWYQATATCIANACQIQPNLPVSTAGGGSFTWRLQAYSPAYGVGITNGPLAFTLVTPTQTTPTGVATTSNPTYTWNKLAGASWYQLFIVGPNGFSIDETVNGSICGASACSTTLSKLLAANGTHSWFMRAWSPDGYGPWTNGLSFNLNGTVPGVITKLAPLGGNVATANVAFSWTHDPSATSYELYLGGPNGWLDFQRWNAATYCSAGTCLINIAVPQNGAYTWYLHGLNGASGPWGAGGSSGGVNFTVAAPMVGQVNKINPVGLNLTSGKVTFSWQPAANATSYELFVLGPNGWSNYQTWDAATTCAAACSVNILVPSNGSYSWYLRGKGAVGLGPWGPNDAGGNYGVANFNVTAVLPAMVVKNSPAEGAPLTNNAVTLAWANTLNATSYEIYLGGPNGFVHFQEHIPGVSATCDATTCTTTLALPNNGTYQWFMRGKSAAGFGSWGPNDAGGNFGLRTFSVQATAPAPNPTLVSPANGSIVGNSVPTITFSWNATGNTTWYNLVLVNRMTGVVTNNWVSAASVGCATGGTCSHTLTLSGGSYRWAVLTWGPGSTGVLPYQPGVTPTFTFDKIGL